MDVDSDCSGRSTSCCLFGCCYIFNCDLYSETQAKVKECFNVKQSILNLLPNSGSAFGKKEKLINEEEDGKSYTEVAVVDNPLYAENEGDVEAYLEEDAEKPEEEFEAEVEVTT